MDAGRGRGRHREFFSLRFFRWVVFHAQSSPHSTNFCRCKLRMCGTANGVLNRHVTSEWATSSHGRWQRRQQMSLESEKIDSTLTGIKSNRTHPSSRKNKNQASRAPPMMLLVEALCLNWWKTAVYGDRGCGGRRPWLACFFVVGVLSMIGSWASLPKLFYPTRRVYLARNSY